MTTASSEVDSPDTEVSVGGGFRAESRSSSSTTTRGAPGVFARATAGNQKPALSSRLPVPRKVSASIPPPLAIGSLRPSASVDLSPSGRPPRIHPPRGIPTISKRGSVTGINTAAGSADPPGSPSIRTPRRPNFGVTDHTSHTTTSLAKRASVPSLGRKPSTSQLSRKTSSSQLQTSAVSTPPRRTSGVNGNVAPPLSRKPSASQLHLSKRPSSSQLARKTSTPQLSSPIAATPSPTPMRRTVSTNLPSPRPPAKSKLPSRPSLSQLRQPSSSTNGPRKLPKTQKPVAAVAVPSPESPSLKKAPGAHKAASQSLRDTIAKARAAHLALLSASKPPAPTDSSASESVGNGLDSFNFSTDDPFNQAIFGEGGSTKVLKQRIKTARVEGRLNISNLQLPAIPDDVYKMYETTEDDLSSADNTDGPKWYESVDLVRLVAADNEIESLDEEMVKQFGGLASIDMHNNLLTALPQNFGELTELTVLNLSNNKLDNGALEIICQITSLVDLKLAKNGLERELESSISKLTNLEILELQENKLESLPLSFGELSKLHVLNISSNLIQSIPFQSLQSCQLHELTASNNKLKGALFPPGVERFDSLQTLDVRNNHISVFGEGSLVLSSLQQLFAGNNGLLSFPSVAGWDELLVFLVDSNRLNALPDGLVGLHRLRTVDVSANDIKTLDARVGTMEGLEVLKFDGNPLRERQLLGMSIADLKRTLKGRLAPPEIVIAEAEDDTTAMPDGLGRGDRVGEPVVASDASAPATVLEVGRGGMLDLSHKNYEDISKDLIDTVMGTPNSVVLLHNKLVAFPMSLGVFAAGLTSLNIGHNKLSGDSYLPNKMALRSLTSLVLQANNITSLQPLLENLDAPKLDTLDVSSNRLAAIDGIRPAFPNLVAFYARDNQIQEIPVDSVDGIKILDLSSNSIGSLPPRLGTLASIRELRVGGNLFRVPRWQVLEKGTESVMEWLRGRLPVDHEQMD